MRDFLKGPDATVPDLFVTNGGSNYATNDLAGLPGFRQADFKRHLREHIVRTADTVSSLPGSPTQVAYISSTYTGQGPTGQASRWDLQRDAYEYMRGIISSLPRSAKVLTSYIDFHTLAGVDECGFSNKFPAFDFDRLDKPDPCGHNYIAKDPHLHGGAYKHQLELLLNLMSEGKRRCDPEPYIPTRDKVIETEEPYIPT